ncbi:plant UBX domain-containing protein 8-like isoform X2 [Mangifera indica]|nr:plant UBX domain-containing protein 8-like isoform X2 [Mangifera indica]
MEIDDPIESGSRAPPFPLRSMPRTLNPFSPLYPNIRRTFFEGGSDFMNREPFVTQPREVREIPIEVKDVSDTSGHAPTVEDVTESTDAYGPESHGTVIIDEVDEDTRLAMAAPTTLQNDGSHERHSSPTSPAFENLPDYTNEIEEEMIRAAIEASKREVEDFSDSRTEHKQTHLEDADLAHAVSLSLKTAEQEKALCQLGGNVEASKAGSSEPAEVELGKAPTSNGRLEAGSSSIQDEAEEVEEQPLVRHRSRHLSSGSMDLPKEARVAEASSPSSPVQRDISDLPQHNGNVFPDEWGGISSEEHDEAVMLEAAMFGGIPESRYNYPYAPHQFMRPDGSFTWRTPRPPSPSLEAQRLIREQQDDEYLASLQADREKELKAREEAEARRLEEEEARKAALEEEKRNEEETRKKMEEEQEYERQLAAKEASLPQEPSTDDENAVTLLVKMPDGSRRGRRFLKSNKLQSLFDFIDIGRGVKAGTYRLVRPYPRRAFGDGESGLTLNELGLTSRQEALFLELI